MIHATDLTFQALVIQRSHQIRVLVDFWATWCGPCKALAPLLLDLERQFPVSLEIVKVDIDAAPYTSTALKITSVPTLVLYRDGQAVARSVGHPGSLVALIQRLGLVA